jgi:hypothetical protein
MPRVSHIWDDKGVVSWPAAGVVTALIVSIALMVAVPFAIKRTSNWLGKLGFLALGIVLASVNLSLAVDAAGQWRDAVTTPAALTAAQVATLNSRITAANDAKAKLPQLPQTSAEEVTAANQAVAIAQAAVDKECVKVGDNCRARQKELNDKVADLAVVVRNRSNTKKIEDYDAEIRSATKELSDKYGLVPGDIPKGTDAAAQRVAKIIGLFYNLGERGDLTVVEWWPTWIAGIIELITEWGPLVILTATTNDGHAPTWHWRLPAWLRKKDMPAVEAMAPADIPVATPAPEAPAAVATAAVKQTAATAAKPKKPSKSKPAAVGDVNSVRQFKECRTIARAGNKVRPKEAFAAYVTWCQEQGIEPVTFTRFGLTMKGELGVQMETTPRKECFYLNIASISAPRLVASNA